MGKEEFSKKLMRQRSQLSESQSHTSEGETRAATPNLSRYTKLLPKLIFISWMISTPNYLLQTRIKFKFGKERWKYAATQLRQGAVRFQVGRSYGSFSCYCSHQQNHRGREN